MGWKWTNIGIAHLSITSKTKINIFLKEKDMKEKRPKRKKNEKEKRRERKKTQKKKDVKEKKTQKKKGRKKKT